MISTHYTVWELNGGGLASGMYTTSARYSTPELARQLGPIDPHLHPGKRIALVKVDTYESAIRGEPTQNVLQCVILEVLPVLSGQLLSEAS